MTKNKFKEEVKKAIAIASEKFENRKYHRISPHHKCLWLEWSWGWLTDVNQASCIAVNISTTMYNIGFEEGANAASAAASYAYYIHETKNRRGACKRHALDLINRVNK